MPKRPGNYLGHYAVPPDGGNNNAKVADGLWNINEANILNKAGRWSGTDPYASSVISQLRFEGTEGSTSIDDDIGTLTWNVSGASRIDTTNAKFGSSSLRGNYTSTEGYIYNTSDETTLGLGQDDWTLEFWFYRNSSDDWGFLTMWTASNGLILGVNKQGSQYRLWLNYIVADGGTLVTGQWQHFAFVRQSLLFRLYIDGSQILTLNRSDTLSVAQIRLGMGYSSTGWSYKNYDDFRFTKGVCRYPDGTSFITPGQLFPPS